MTERHDLHECNRSVVCSAFVMSCIAHLLVGYSRRGDGPACWHFGADGISLTVAIIFYMYRKMNPRETRFYCGLVGSRTLTAHASLLSAHGYGCDKVTSQYNFP